MDIFEPYPMNDMIQNFCEEHIDKMKIYMDKISRRIPLPSECTFEDKVGKKSVKLHFACQAKGANCLYAETFFSSRTRYFSTWIQLMFISIQTRHSHALSLRDGQVARLKRCWDLLKCRNKTFSKIVTSGFPCEKELENLINELRQLGYFDVFQICQPNLDLSSEQPVHLQIFRWGCYLCAHPERAADFLKGDTETIIEGQLKEKTGKWRLFRRWRTRYITLYGAHLCVAGPSGGEFIDVDRITSVKVSRSSRNIPKSFEIFTDNQTLILKPTDEKNAEEWVRCLNIVVAHSRAKELPGKSNSLPATGIGASRSFSPKT